MKLLEFLRSVEWSGRDGGVGAACCIGCGALYNGDEDFAEPHAPDCSYVEALREVEALKRDLAATRSIAKILQENGCDCECDHSSEEHDAECERCLACRIADAMPPPR